MVGVKRGKGRAIGKEIGTEKDRDLETRINRILLQDRRKIIGGFEQVTAVT